MKRSIAFIAMMIVAAACTRQQEQDFNPCPTGQELTLTAYAPGIEAPSKTSRDADGKVYWSAAEEISLFYGSGENGGSKFTSTNTTSSKTAQFSGVINVITGIVEDVDDVSFWGIYPYNSENACDGTSATMVIPDVQTSEEGTFSDGCFPSIGKSTGLLMGFYNVCGGFKFRLSQEGITRVTFRGNNNEDIAGKVKVAFGNDNKPAVTEIVSGEKEIVITPAAGGAFQTEVDYFIVIRPVTFSQGVTFVFEKANGSKGTRSVNVSFPINRSQFQHSSSAIDTGVEFAFIPEMVDLGLSVKWANTNLGAIAETDKGDYYAWAETAPKDSYNGFSYKWFSYYDDFQNCKISKYVTKNDANVDYGPLDYRYVIEAEDDAASLKYGGDWRLPTKAEIQELINNCSWEWQDNYNGVSGYIVTSKVEGYTEQSIFLPMTGYMYDSKVKEINNFSNYWASNIHETNPRSSWGMIIYNPDYSSNYGKGKVEPWALPRDNGAVIRPVCGKKIEVTSLTLDKTSLELGKGQTYTLYVTLTPSKAPNFGIVWKSTNESVVTVTDKSTVNRYEHYMKAEVTAVDFGEATIIAESVDTGVQAICSIVVGEP